VEERASWRTVIYLNLVRSVNTILDLIKDEMLKTPSTPDHASSFGFPGISDTSDQPFQISGPLKVLRLRLGPLQQIQKDLEAMLGSGSSEPVDLSRTHAFTSVAPFLDHGHSLPSPEFFIRSNCGWKSALDKVRLSLRGTNDEERPKALLKQTDEISEVIHSCREDIKALWEDPVVRELLKKRNVVLEESSGL
jgi:guanine nucleotide-binding protein alpha-1 subunit